MNVWEEDNRTFCMLPFSHFSPRADGKVKICSECTHFDGIPKTGTVDDLDIKSGSFPGKEIFNLNDGDTLEDVWNSEFYIDLRQKMLKGEYISLCEQCYLDDQVAGYENLKIDVEGEQAVIHASKRYQLTYAMGFVNDYIDVIKYAQNNNGHMGDYRPQRYEMRLSNICNLACRMCSPENSTLFAKEVVNKPDIFSFVDPEYFKKYLPGRKELDNNEQIINDIISNLDRTHFLEIHGGEPTYHDGLWKVIKAAVKSGDSKHIIIDGHTNLQGLEEWHVELLNEFKRVKIGLSIDAYDEENKYIRYPADWNIINEKMKLVAKLDNKIAYKRVHTVVQYWNAPTLYKLSNWIEQVNKEYNAGVAHTLDKVVLTLVYRAEMLPKELRLQGADKLEEFMQTSSLCNPKSKYRAKKYNKWWPGQLGHYKSIIEYLRKDYNIDELNASLGKGWHGHTYNYQKLYDLTTAWDKSRKVSYKDVFPHMPDLEDFL